MRYLVVTLLAVVAVIHARSLEDVIELEKSTKYNYMNRFGIPLAKQLLNTEKNDRRASKIVGGSLAALGQFPYQAGLIIDTPAGVGVAGGMLVSSTRVLTAAHNWYDGHGQGLWVTVVLGTTTIFSGGTELGTSDVILHENWSISLMRNDIAMINLPEAVLFSDTIAPIALPSGSQLEEDFAGEVAVASGFGKTGDAAGIPRDQPLSFVPLPVISNEECARSFSDGFILSSHICASGADGKSTCTGDSGGPLVVTRDDTPILIGITSFSSGRSCEAGGPVGFTRVTYYRDWIDNHL